MTNLNLRKNQLAQDYFASQVAARLSDATDALPYDISERLRAARVQALAKRKILVIQTAGSVAVSGGEATLTFGNEHLSGWSRLAAMLPLLALIVGLIAINVIQNDKRADEIAEIDSALLTDDLPPSAYTDAGFAQFLKLSSVQHH